MREVNSARFFVVGEVVHPGAFPLRSEINALQALALAGGLGEFSDRDELTVVRGDTGEQETIALDDLHSGRMLGIRAGDTLVVP